MRVGIRFQLTLSSSIPIRDDKEVCFFASEKNEVVFLVVRGQAALMASAKKELTRCDMPPRVTKTAVRLDYASSKPTKRQGKAGKQFVFHPRRPRFENSQKTSLRCRKRETSDLATPRSRCPFLLRHPNPMQHAPCIRAPKLHSTRVRGQASSHRDTEPRGFLRLVPQRKEKYWDASLATDFATRGILRGAE
jgi:hypothetical protein